MPKATAPTPKSLKVMINKQKSKVVFAEASSHVADVLLSFLTLPLGKIVQILEKHYDGKAPVIGSLSTLYRGLSNLDSSYFCVRGAKEMLFNQRSSFEDEWRRLTFDFTHSQPPKYFLCLYSRDCNFPPHLNISMYSDIAKCECGESLKFGLPVQRPPAEGDDDGGFITISATSFIITDDLRMAPIVSGLVQTLNNLGITEFDGAEFMSFSFGINEVMMLLEYSLTSSTPLTDLILRNEMKNFTAPKPERSISLDRFDKKAMESRKKISIKISLQKSTNKFLFAQATEEFVDFLLAFLTVPLGGIESLFGGNTCLENFVNLSRSVSDFIDNKYFRAPDLKDRVLNPKLAHGFITKDELLLPLTDDIPTKLYYEESLSTFYDRRNGFNNRGDGSLVSFKSIKSLHENYVKKNAMCFVTDDLTMSPSMEAAIPIIKDLGISLSDVRELELQIGMEEVLSLLKAALSSTTALSTDAIINPMQQTTEVTAAPPQARI